MSLKRIKQGDAPVCSTGGRALIQDQSILLDEWNPFVTSNLVWRISSVHRLTRRLPGNRVSEQNDFVLTLGEATR